MVQKLTLEEVPAAVAELHTKLDDLTGKVAALFETKEAQDERLLSAGEACKMFVPAISRLTLIRWTKADYLKEHRIGGRVYYRQSQVIDAAKHIVKYKNRKA
ncbi:MAG: helix-turn-helix domain-containing protein [Taibaiella sp.]|nr:helix-turn-helix domain-containing protein [Taibaiella sp.]